LIPIALNPNPLIAPLAIVLIGGLISSTIPSSNVQAHPTTDRRENNEK